MGKIKDRDKPLRAQWARKFEWLRKSSNGSYSCHFCKSTLSKKITCFQKHEQSKKHIDSVNHSAATVSVRKFVESKSTKSDTIKTLEIRLAAHFVMHASANSAECLPLLISSKSTYSIMFDYYYFSGGTYILSHLFSQAQGINLVFFPVCFTLNTVDTCNIGHQRPDFSKLNLFGFDDYYGYVFFWLYLSVS